MTLEAILIVLLELLLLFLAQDDIVTTLVGLFEVLRDLGLLLSQELFAIHVLALLVFLGGNLLLLLIFAQLLELLLLLLFDEGLLTRVPLVERLLLDQLSLLGSLSVGRTALFIVHADWDAAATKVRIGELLLKLFLSVLTLLILALLGVLVVLLFCLFLQSDRILDLARTTVDSGRQLIEALLSGQKNLFEHLGDLLIVRSILQVLLGDL